MALTYRGVLWSYRHGSSVFYAPTWFAKIMIHVYNNYPKFEMVKQQEKMTLYPPLMYLHRQNIKASCIVVSSCIMTSQAKLFGSFIMTAAAYPVIQFINQHHNSAFHS